MKKKLTILLLAVTCVLRAQINTDRVLEIGRNALYYEDYVLAIQYFNQVIKAKPYLAEPYYFRAIAKFSLDDVKGAEEDCTACLERNPFITNAYWVRGDARQQLKNYKGAREDYLNVLRDMPGREQVLIYLGIANTELKNFGEAEKNLEDVVKSHPSNNVAYLALARLNLERKDSIAALKDYDKAIEANKFSAQSYTLRALLYTQRKDYEKASKDYDEALKLDPTITSNYINRSLIKYYKNDLRGAMADYDKAIDIEPNNLIARFNRGLLRAQVGDDNRAIEDLNVVIQHEPENYIAYYNRAILKNSISDFKGAIRDLNTVMSEYPDYYQGFYLRAELKKRLGDLKGSEKDFLYAHGLELANQRSLATQKGRNEAQKREKERDKELQKTREDSNKDIDKFNLLVVADPSDEKPVTTKYKDELRGRVQDKRVKIELLPKFMISYYEKLKEAANFVYYSPLLDQANANPVFHRKLRLTNDEASLTEAQIDTHFKLIEEYSKQIGEQPASAVLYFARGMEYLTVQDFANASEDFKKAIQLDDKFTLAYFNLGVVTSKQVDMRHTGAEYEAMPATSKPSAGKTAVVPPPTGIVSPNLGNATISQDKIDFDFILHNYDKAVALAPKFEYAYYNRAEIKSILKDYKAAIEDYDTVIKIDPELAEAYFNRGICRLATQDTKAGLDDLSRAGELGIVEAYSIIKRMTSEQ